MRPLRLTLEAFGPYADRQVVDFDLALKAGLFGIYGPTGAGKSSIFSAISFALFGEAAKGEQDISTLRSQHARDEVLTEVELVFEHGTKRFCVRRHPTQARPLRRGGGTTEMQHAAWLFDASDIAPCDISRENSGTPIAERKVTDVDAAVKAILGYGAAQFRQIVLLPQGRFETFLTTNTKDRLTILRELFDVSIFEGLAAQLGKEAATSRANIAAGHAASRARIEQLGFTTFEELIASAEVARKEVAPLAAAHQESRAVHVRALQAAEAAGAIAEKFMEKDAAEEQVQTLDARSGDIEGKKIELRGLQAVAALGDADDRYSRALTELKKREEDVHTVQGRLQVAIEEAALKAKNLAEARGRRGEIDALKARGSILEHLLKDSAALAPLRDALRQAETRLNGSHLACEQAEERHAGLLSKKVSLDRQLDIASAAFERRSDLESRKRALDDRLKALLAREAAENELERARAAHAAAESELREATQLERTAEAVHAEAQAALQAAEAARLAATLEDGVPCPVCGASDHPAPAAPAIGNGETTEPHDPWKVSKARLDTARTSRISREVNLARRAERLSACQGTLEELPDVGGVASELRDALRDIDADLAALGSVADRAELKSHLEACDQELAKAGEHLAVSRNRLDADGRARAAAAQSLTDAQARIPVDLRADGAIEAELAQVVQECGRLESELANAEAEDRKSAELVAALRVSAARALEEAERSKGERDEAERVFLAGLSATGLSGSLYRSHKSRLDARASLESEIRNHEEAVAIARDRRSRAIDNTVNLDRLDVAAMQAALAVAVGQEREAQAAFLAATARALELESAVTHLRAARTESGVREAAHAPLGAVAEIVNGNNRYNMTLETYAIAAMFDEVLAAANARLRPMSNHRYTLRRRSEPGKGRGGRGLDMEVHDAFSDKTRHTNTLSGGESFQAALSLALGLSDVVERRSGGIRLDMIFIDEGFGSLDGDALDQALQALQELVGQRRAVGLISHVPQVQEAIPVGFRIEKGMRGSRIAVRTA